MGSEEERAVLEGQSTLSSLAGKYLTFRLAAEEYGIAILKVVEIIKLMDITRVPRTPSCVRGVINLRGRVIPVIELRAKFAMDSLQDSSETCIIVVKTLTDTQMGVLVDTVSEVLDIAPAELEPAPRFGSAVETDFILAMAKTRTGAVKILLDIDRVLSAQEMAELTRATA
jgi:purine-binding chemotaxis protein CheW